MALFYFALHENVLFFFTKKERLVAEMR
jgi:hypothetical protein